MSASSREQEQLSLESRIQAFYRQSGGPGNPQIQKILQNHLLYGKDHGRSGYRETLEDAFIDAVNKDHSMLLLFQRLITWRQKRSVQRTLSTEWQQSLFQVQQEVRQLREQISQLEQTVLQNLSCDDAQTRSADQAFSK